MGKNKSLKQMPYTRKEYISSIPGIRLAKMTLGTARDDYKVLYEIRTQKKGLVSDRALESIRIMVNKILQKEIGQGNYLLKVIKYPHIILRKHKMLTGAGADRLSEGMKRAYGKPIGLAAKVKENDVLLKIWMLEERPRLMKRILRVISPKIPVGCRLAVSKLEAA
ncbi:50S ribosomal protein L16 [Candidatus Bathyarchaeota archaeon ex4484_205]|nr:MAG: 50S ribosomal protein L16 [Candidatus Bathyarchaeota archaeon ex4484_205]